ncbi:Enamine deaminase RidA, house cleaning of reactive enamine intermediates, YjgF/YER057c/UK114 family [Pedobacter rhizosphaerae]|uniref:Enamine deaminase RidA, house cleaning of reactive enamine intermediates, YjgF/YER057c/UK114 family n=2 Tax=Pedobacter rhizosphaerae TaxID=390241 RepID=A0A1H9TPT1_9SPHI|nr:Enamine deaminase RidA, house cleaning of reactive enamine intermediates, YjgF/YER057c/UK114 family [Pedobacter rhizosphaerae]
MFASMETENLQITNPEGIYDPRPHGYSHLASISPNSKLVYVAGQGGSKTDGLLSNDFRTQVQIVFDNIAIALRSEGLEMKHIAKLTTLVVDYDEAKHEVLIEESNKIWPDLKFPVNTLIPVQRLALTGMLIEIDATAVA